MGSTIFVPSGGLNMSKIICDVCGTSYPESATQCPICGCVRPVDVVTVSNETETNEVQSRGNYTYVKGGRFSKSNVKKRNSASHAAPNKNDIEQDESGDGTKKSNTGLIIAVCILLAAIIAVSIYIAMHFFGPGLSKKPDSTAGATTETVQDTNDTGESTAETTEETIVALPCEDIILSNTVVEFDKAGAANLINYITVPETTTDAVVFSSSDETVATVDQNGKIESVAPGEAIITIRCGEVEKQCTVKCIFEVEETDPSEETSAPTTEQTDKKGLKLNYIFTLPENPEIGDVTLTKKGSTWTAYIDSSNELPASQVVFTSSDASVVTIDEKGVVTAVGAGEAIITAEYKDQKAKCRVICKFAG
jgi:uncharacterized protein YjdB